MSTTPPPKRTLAELEHMRGEIIRLRENASKAYKAGRGAYAYQQLSEAYTILLTYLTLLEYEAAQTQDKLTYVEHFLHNEGYTVEAKDAEDFLSSLSIKL